MKKLSPLLLRIFLFGLFAFHLFSLEGDGQMLTAIVVSKSLLMPALALVYYLLAKQSPHHKLDLWIFFALIFSWVGDVVLIKGHESPNFFLCGIGAFLLAQVFYTVSFYRDMRRTSETSLIVARPHLALPIVIIAFLFVYNLLPFLDEFKLPVISYTIVISSMVLAALNRWKKIQTASFWLVFIGAASFFSSDAMIAVNKFHTSFDGARLAIMSTYILGQWLIVEGILLRKD